LAICRFFCKINNLKKPFYREFLMGFSQLRDKKQRFDFSVVVYVLVKTVYLSLYLDKNFLNFWVK